MYLRIDEHKQENYAVIEDNGNQYTYADMLEACALFGNIIEKRNVIFILCRNSFAAIAGHVACVENKIVPLMISEKMDDELLSNLIKMYQPRYLWMPQEKDIPYETVIEKYGYKLVETGYETYPVHEELALLLTTSGSTGSPKLVRHKYSNLFCNARNVASVFQFTDEDNALIDLQLHYTMGLNVACSNLYAGATLLMTTYNILEKGYWDFFEKSKVTNICGVPYSYGMLKRIKFFKKEHPDLRIIAEGGGRLTDELFKEIAGYADKYGKKFFATFGTSETTARLAFLSPNKAHEKTGSIGQAIPEGRLFLIDDHGKEIEEAEGTGELAYEGPNVTLGYALCKEDLLKGDERNGIYHTGDIAYRDEEGFYYILGRKSRFLKLFGHRVGLDEAEQLIRSKYQIECACAGNDDRMKIYITIPEYVDDIKHFIAEKTNIQISAFEVKVLDSIPKNEVGKIMYSKLEEKVERNFC